MFYPMSWAVRALSSVCSHNGKWLLPPCSQHPYLKATWLTVVQCGRTVIPVLAGSSHTEGTGLGGCHLHSGKSVHEGQYCGRSFLRSLWWIRVTGTVFTIKMMPSSVQARIGYKKNIFFLSFFTFTFFYLLSLHFFRLSIWMWTSRQ